MVTELLIVLLLVLANGLFAGSEIAVLTARKGHLQERVAARDRRALAVHTLREQPERFLATVQVAITVVTATAAAFGGATIAGHLEPLLAKIPPIAEHADEISVAIVVVLVSYLSLVVGELVPKRLALADPERAASRAAPLFFRLARLFRPGIWLLRSSSDLVLRLLGVKEEAGSRVTEDEIRALIAEGAQAGIVQPVEHELIEGVMQIADQPVRSIMTPRTEVTWLDAHAGQPDSGCGRSRCAQPLSRLSRPTR